MDTVVARLSTKYQVVIPKAVREALQLGPKDRVLFLIDGETVCLRPEPRSFTATLRGLYADLWPDPDTWLEQERASWE